MKALDFIINFKFIIFPEFYTVKDLQNNEYVFLKTNETAIDSLELVKDKTQTEAFENHVHIFGKTKRKEQEKVLEATRLIIDNLIRNLKINFPNKKFHVYLDCDFFDHVIIRFHQHWEDELPYYNVREFPNIEEYTIGM